MSDTMAQVRGNDSSMAGTLASSLRDALLVIAVVLLIGALYQAFTSYPDLKRYMNIKQM